MAFCHWRFRKQVLAFLSATRWVHLWVFGIWFGSLVAAPRPLDATGAEERLPTGRIEGTVRSPWIRRLPGIVYIERVEGRSYAPPDTHAVMDQKDLVYRPHLLPILTGTTVDFPNSDVVRHSVFSTRKSTIVFNLGTYPPGVVKQIKFDQPGVTTLLCNVHAEMVAYIVTLETPFYSLTDSKGKFVLEGVPVGTHKLVFWHEKLKPVTQEVEIKESEVTEVTFANLKGK